MKVSTSHYCDLPECINRVKFDENDRPLFFDYAPDGIQEYLFCSDDCMQDWLTNCYEELFGFLPGEMEQEYA